MKIASLLKGQKLMGGPSTDTINALGQVNGKQDNATPEQVKTLKEHIKTYQPPTHDLREPMRRIEQKFLTEYTGPLIGNQCLDFQKQDGITEIEESIMANHIERGLNDLLLRDEDAGKITVNRKPIYISCVSNFTNFLDLFRKTIRSMEVGTPCVVLGRTNTSQHSYRWAKILMDLCEAEGVDSGMITYLACPLEDIKEITQSCKDYTGNLYSTCSRELAEAIKSGYPNTITSTGGPNTLVNMDWTDGIQEATRMSATIESSGQCTALRHVVVPPSVSEQDVANMLEGTKSAGSAPEALQESAFDCIFPNHKGSAPGPTGNGYQRHATVDASYRVSDKLPPNDIVEYWRKVVLDVSKIDAADHIDELADWLNTNQPISLAVNGKTREQSLDVGFKLWERTGLVVNTIGNPENPALSCQARPQEAEVFGEFPPRRLLDRYTKYPVVVPSSTPSYDSAYTDRYLQEQAKKPVTGNSEALLKDVSDDKVKGYCVTLLEYLNDATQENPKRSFGTDRTAMWGLQRPPLQTTTYLHCNTSWDDLVPSLLLFLATNAKDQVVVLTENGSIKALCEKHGVPVKVVNDGSLKPGDNLKDITGPTENAMVGQFLTTLFPVGHIKSTRSNDDEFCDRVKVLQKWLKVVN
jgi:hypothetical protein